MDNLISRKAAIDAVLDRMNVEKYGRNAKAEEIRWTLERLPSAQPKIIRCKDCKHYKDGECTNTFWGMCERDFCSE